MADTPGHFPFEIREDENENKDIREYFTEYSHIYIRVGPKNYTLLEDYKDEAAQIYNMPLRPDDVWVVTFPRSGTTLTQELVWLIANDLDYAKAASINLSTRYKFLEFSMFLNKGLREKLLQHSNGSEQIRKVLDSFSTSGSQEVAEIPSPRYIKSHLPLTLLPTTLLDTSKVVYVARDPRDVAVSYFHLNKLFRLIPHDGEFKTYWKFFMRGLLPWGPFFEHIKEAWEMRNHTNMLFLFYEDLIKDIPGSLRKVADFFGKHYTDEQIEGLSTHLRFDNFKKNPSVNYDQLKELGLLSKHETFIRKGKSEGWHEYFDEDGAREAEQWIYDNLRNTDLRFPTMI